MCIGSIKFKSSVSTGSPLWSVTGGEVEARLLKFLHSASSKGVFISVSSSGILVVNDSEVGPETTRYEVFKCGMLTFLLDRVFFLYIFKL
jgi:hypothetical protein